MSIVSNAKEIADLVKKLGDIELYRKIIELEGEIIELTRANHSLELRVQELTSTLTITQQLTSKYLKVETMSVKTSKILVQIVAHVQNNSYL